ncbi:16S rRNA (guanine(966)-N(2))-methyltransferase RsmD [Rubellicoccus peritrichatus]|uniref:16S rRNA (Guanine(966)-N(2))-methyltransferase RsmD n=1 Tax=Rubellicoccus peritrichatus TaxID=3080537 RepID=A0AAQ3LBN0_9BACT|nr:16S rRNA (guanine(966)-N(2))-methyltransferase RsmD [Puniceicoccus sp. CR14]WOO43109.1 16S rRNA (guanine(966)-N(2))-methyltransferase RsmD [Puniceicoccus sp. CR14]
MRITGGQARGIPLKAPPGNQVRPAMDAMREAIFSSLGLRINEAKVLDLFAGSGAYGLEALSRGAASCCFVEKDRRTLSFLESNASAVAKSIGEKMNYQSVRMDAMKWQAGSQKYDIIFIDPPYPLLNEHGLAMLKQAAPLLTTSENSRLILEAPGGWEPTGNIEEIQPSLNLLKRLGKGRNQPSALVFSL